MRILALLFLLVAGPAIAQDASLVGNSKLVGFQTVVEGEPSKDIYGAQPEGISDPHSGGTRGRNHHGRNPQGRNQ